MNRWTMFFLLFGAMLGWGCEEDKGGIDGIEVVTPTDALHAFQDSVFDAAVLRDPIWQSRMGIKEDYGKWPDLSDAAEAKELGHWQAALKEMKARWKPEDLDEQGQLSYKLFVYRVEQMEKAEQWRYHSYPVEQMHGFQSDVISFMINVHNVDNRADAEAYISRLRGMKELLGQIVGNLKTRAQMGIIPPKFVFPMVLNDCRNIISGFPFEESEDYSPLYEDLEKKVLKLNLPLQEAADILLEAQTAMKEGTLPGYTLLISTLEELEARADTRDVVWKFPDGPAFYQYALEKNTTMAMGPEEIHEFGLQEVDRIHQEMKEIMRQVKFKGNLQDFFEFMRTDEQFFYPNTEEGKQAYLDRANAIIDSMRQRLPDLFYTLPKADLVVKRVAAYREKSAGKAFYSQPAPDGSRPGYYFANLYDMANMPTYQMEALAYHEAIPGHHMQLSIAQELTGLPKFRRHQTYTAYVEGWGLYAEKLGKEIGFYEDPYSDFGRLAMELWRACRLVVDTGIHEMKWTREQAIDYLKENTPNPEGDIVKAIERYIVMPGQATAYKLGMQKIEDLRAYAQQELKGKMDIRAFHDLILKNGALPLDMLEKTVQDWVAERGTL